MYCSEDFSVKWSKLFHFILKLFGLACYTKSDKTGRFITSTPYDKFIFVATLCLWITFTFFQIRQKIILDETIEVDEKLLYNLWMDLYIVQNFLVIIVVFWNFLHRNKIEKLFNILDNFDQKVSIFNQKAESAGKYYKTAVLLFMFHFIMTKIYMVIYVIDRLLIDSTVLFNAFNDFFVLLFYVALSGQFAATVCEIHNRLIILNNNLK